MTIGSGARVDLSYVVEVTHGTTPGSPSMKLLRTTGRNLNLMKDMLLSQEVRSDRQVSDLRHGFNHIDGTIPYELSSAAYDDLLEGALSGTWATVTTGALSQAPNSAGTFTRSTGSYITDGFRVGDWITASGFSDSGNNSKFQVTTVTTTVLTVLGTLTTHAAESGTIIVTGHRLDIGTTLRTFTFERRFNDLTQYQVFRGVAVGGLDLKIDPTSMVGGSLTLLGMSSPALSGSSLGSPAAAPTHSPFSAFDGTLYEGSIATPIAIVTGLTLKLENGRVLKPVVGSKFSPDVFEGTAKITGTLTAFFDSVTMLNKFINETESSLYLRLNDINGTDFFAINIPRLKYTGGEIDPPQEGPVPITLPFQALVDSITATSLFMQRSN